MLRFFSQGALVVAGLGLILFAVTVPVPSATGGDEVRCRVRAEAGETKEKTCPAAENRGCTAPISVKLEAEIGTGVLVPSATVFCGGGVALGGSEATCNLGAGVSTCEVTNNLFSNVYTTGNGCRVSAGPNEHAVAVCTFATP